MYDFIYTVETDKKDGHEYAMITGCGGNVRSLVIPGKIDGYSVEAIGNHAFSGRKDILYVTIPQSVRTIYAYAFHDCRNLRKITLFDSIDDYYDGVCRQCDSLREVDITLKRGWYEVIRNFLADSDKTLRFMIRDLSTEESVTSCLTFPEYVYDFNENTMARTIQFSIAGSGYAYRECVDRRSINYSEYDKLFNKAVIDAGPVPEDIALGRLLYPAGLLQGYKKTYEDFVLERSEKILARLVEGASSGDESEDENAALLRRILEYKKDDGSRIVTEDAIDRASHLSSEKKLTLLCAAFLDESSFSKESLTFEF